MAAGIAMNFLIKILFIKTRKFYCKINFEKFYDFLTFEKIVIKN